MGGELSRDTQRLTIFVPKPEFKKIFILQRIIKHMQKKQLFTALIIVGILVISGCTVLKKNNEGNDS